VTISDNGGNFLVTKWHLNPLLSFGLLQFKFGNILHQSTGKCL